MRGAAYAATTVLIDSVAQNSIKYFFDIDGNEEGTYLLEKGITLSSAAGVAYVFNYMGYPVHNLPSQR